MSDEEHEHISPEDGAPVPRRVLLEQQHRNAVSAVMSQLFGENPVEPGYDDFCFIVLRRPTDGTAPIPEIHCTDWSRLQFYGDVLHEVFQTIYAPPYTTESGESDEGGEVEE